jgi:hypothetical protein
MESSQPAFQESTLGIEQTIKLAFTWQELQQVFYSKPYELQLVHVLAVVERLSELASSAVALGVPPPSEQRYQVRC